MIPETNPYNNWSGNGSSTTFDFDFYIEDATQLAVYRTGSDGTQTQLTYGTDYSINEFKNENGSYITFPLAGSSYSTLASNEVISLCLTLPISQQNPFGKSSYLNLETLEYSLDYITRICQIIQRELERAVKVKEGSDVDTDELTQDLIIVADNITDVNTVSSNISNVNTVKNNISDVNTVAGSISNVNSTGSNIANVNTVASNISNVNTVKDSISNVNTVAGDIANVNAVAGNKTNIDAVKNNATNINTVAGDKTNIDTVATNISKVNTVATNISHVSTVSTNISNVNTVAGDKTNIDTVAADKTNIDTCASNISAINAAPTYAETATTQAGIATDKADACIAALVEADSLKNSLRLFNTINAGKLADTRSVYINAGALSDTRSDYLNGGTLSDWHIAGDDIKNILALPLLYKQAADTETELAAAELRIAQNESNIADIQGHLTTNDADIDSLEDRVTECEGDIDDLEGDMSDANTEINSAKGRITQNESDIAALQGLTDLFNIINSGKLSDTRSNYLNAGALSDTRSNYTNAGTLVNLTVSKDNLRAISLVPALRAEIESLKEQLVTALEFITNIKGGIDCGTIVK